MIESARPIRRAALVVAALLVLVGCAPTAQPAMPSPDSAAAQSPVEARLASHPAQLADDLVADEKALRDPASSEAVLNAAAHRQQLAYRALGRHPEWDPVVRPRIPAELVGVYDLNVNARRQLHAISKGHGADTLPAWRINAPAPADELMRYYREAEAATGVGWNYLAAINFVETAFGRIAGVSTAGAQGPMQFLPSTFAMYSKGDINAPRDAILAAGQFLAAHDFARDPAAALYRYNLSDQYVRAISDYAAVLAADPGAFAGYYRWNVYFNTTDGDVLLPTGYAATAPMPVTNQPVAAPEVRISAESDQILDRLLKVRNDTRPADRPDVVSRGFLGVPYGANTLVGSAREPEQLVVDLQAVDCFTYADYVEALKRASNRGEFVDGLIGVRYKNGVVTFQNRKHFFTDWAASTPAVATDVTATVSPSSVRVEKNLNQKDGGGVYLAGMPVVPRAVTYIPSGRVDNGVLDGLRTGDYVGAYAEDGGLDVTHVGIFVATPGGPVFRNASSLQRDMQVVDTPFLDYVRSVPGIVVLRPVM